MSRSEELKRLKFSDRDEFDRKKTAEKLLTLLKSNIDVTPMVIDGDWGTGKSEFCCKLINLMKDESLKQSEESSKLCEPHLVYIDAYKADHADAPLMTILAEIIKLQPDKEKQQALKQKAIPVAKFAFKTIGKALSSHILKQDMTDVVDDYEKDIKKAGDKAIDDAVDALLDEHIDADKNLKTLQEALTLIATDNPIVIFIDELDRCRPNFAVDMLEVVKHIFDVENVKFVLVTNTKQLEAAINHCYGQTIDAKRYLDKFVKYKFILPERVRLPNEYHDVRVTFSHFKQLVKYSTTLSESGLIKGVACELVNHIIEVHRLSLREIETLVRYLEIYHQLSNSEGLKHNLKKGFLIIRIAAVAMYCFKPAIIDSIDKNKIDCEQLAKFLAESDISKINLDDYENNAAQVMLKFMYVAGGGKDSKAGDDHELMRQQFYQWGFPYADGAHHTFIEVLNQLRCL